MIASVRPLSKRGRGLNDDGNAEYLQEVNDVRGEKPKEHGTEVYHELDGYFVCTGFADDCIREALRYKPRSDDLFIVSYPKCGTTWMQHIVYNILSGRPPPRDLMEQSVVMPFLELQGADCAHAMPRPGAIKTHMPFHLHPYSPEAKYIYITRNPYDCCVSFYYHTKSVPEYHFEHGNFDQFLEMFLEGRVDFGDYFEHLLSWYGHRYDANVLFLTYEDLKQNTAFWILTIADFIDKNYAAKLKLHDGLLGGLLNNTSVEYMKETLNEENRKMKQTMNSIPEERKPRWIKMIQETVDGETMEKPIDGDFVRKGIVGDWKNHFTPPQVARMKQRIALKTAGSDVMNLWKNMDLP
ncbi:hypothetical protein V5799_016221 [Amblyomma americanum]|uniref:Sulfotransferase domain-containing protein n=1 Tax=Amblyomma americanum TaxID=6943 RepID=A0AAQ4F5N2_AMBAM